ncbi:MAG: hypothetical protein V3V00_07910 [Saprospiraceae bacterium]
MAIKLRLFFYVIATYILTLLSCAENDELERKEEWIKKEVQNQIITYKKEMRNECMAEILLKVEAEVDSLLSQKNLFVLDKDIPNKPVKPEFVSLDTLALNNHEVRKVLK